MAFAFIIAGILLTVSAVRNTQNVLFSTLQSDFTGSDNFLIWLAAFLLIGVIGYVKELKPFSSAMLVLVCVVILLSNKGFFADFQQQISSTSSTTPTVSGSVGGVAASGNSTTIISN